MTGQDERKKVFVLGIDGATFDVIHPLIRRGELPNLKKIMESGVHGHLESTIPANSAPAWTSFVTGMNPGNHGIFHFKSLGYQTQSYLMNRHSRTSKAVWNILSDHGKKVGVVNVPMTFPPETVNGFLVSGMDTPSKNVCFTYPEPLGRELELATGDYQIEAQLSDLVRIRSDRDRHRFIRAVQYTMEQRFKAVKYLMASKDWDFFLAVFMPLDRFQHRLWKYMDTRHPHHDPNASEPFKDVIFQTYRRMDEIVGDLANRLDEQTTLMIMSDHGFGPAPVRGFNMNNWLAENNYLTYKTTGNSAGLDNLLPGFINLLQMHMPIGLRHFIREKFRSQVNRVQLSSRLGGIDWGKTRVYSDQHVEIYSTIWINLVGREPWGIVRPEDYEVLLKELTGRLKAIRDPSGLKPAVRNVHRRDALFWGPKSHKAPDLVIEWNQDQFRTQSSPLFNGTSVFSDITPGETSQTISGEHKRNAIFILSGKGVKKNAGIRGARISDLAPTILHLLGIDIPDAMDGDVLWDVYESPEKLPACRSGESVSIAGDKDEAFSPGDQALVEARLKELGYL